MLASCGGAEQHPADASSGDEPRAQPSPATATMARSSSPPAQEPADPPAAAEAPEPGGHALEGFATWYGPGFAGRRTANGERFDPSRMTAAHRTLPFGTRVRVVSERTGQSVVVRINDRGPFGHADRIIDLARGAARRIGLDRAGVMRVRLEILP